MITGSQENNDGGGGVELKSSCPQALVDINLNQSELLDMMFEMNQFLICQNKVW